MELLKITEEQMCGWFRDTNRYILFMVIIDFSNLSEK